MTEFLQWIQAGSTPFVAFLAYLVWDLKRNHIAHIERSVSRLESGVAFLMGRDKERDEQ